MESNRIIGFGLLITGVVLAFVGVAWGVANLGSGSLQVTGFLLLLAVWLPVVGMLMFAGLYVLRRTAGEMAQMTHVKRQKKILNALQTEGRLSVAEAALEVDVTAEQVKQDIYDLVGKRLFTGYIDWDDGMLYSRQARDLRASGQCPNCGGSLELVGKGVVKCPYCATEIFL